MPETMVYVESFDVRDTKAKTKYADLTINLGKNYSFQRIPAKIWGWTEFRDEAKQGLASGCFISCTFSEESYKGALQWNIKSFRVLEEGEKDAIASNFAIPSPIDKRYASRFASLRAFLDQEPESPASRITNGVFNDIGVMDAYNEAPAAKNNHQNYPGGLLEHSVNVTLIALRVAELYDPLKERALSVGGLYPTIDHKVIIAAGLMHDIGKITNYKFSPMPEKTDTYRFENHLPISHALARKHAEVFLALGEGHPNFIQASKILNAILAHHGSLPTGSPIDPACLEAMILARADGLDAMIATVSSAWYSAKQSNTKVSWVYPKPYPGECYVGDWKPKV